MAGATTPCSNMILLSTAKQQLLAGPLLQWSSVMVGLRFFGQISISHGNGAQLIALLHQTGQNRRKSCLYPGHLFTGASYCRLVCGAGQQLYYPSANITCTSAVLQRSVIICNVGLMVLLPDIQNATTPKHCRCFISRMKMMHTCINMSDWAEQT